MRAEFRVASRAVLAALCALVVFAFTREAGAVPAFARKYQTSCTTCHTVYPMLNSFGEAFRRNGYRFPSQGGADDTDVTKAEIISLGQEEYKKQFPNSVWPASIPQSIPIGIMMNGAVTMNVPNQDAHAAAGNTFAWNGLLSEFHIFGAGSINENLTYFTQLTASSDGLDLETGYLLWNDVLGPRHMFNVWVGRLMQPSLTSFGMHSSYLNDSVSPAVSVNGLFNPTGSFVLGQGHTDGVEFNGVVGHRFDWSLGYVASGAVAALGRQPNSQDLYGHVGFKLGGMSFDGEGSGGATVPDASKPWAETSLVVDFFGYHGMQVVDAGISADGTASGQNNAINAVGGSLRLTLGSLLFTSGLQYERHSAPFQGTAGTPATATTPAVDGTADRATGSSIVQFDELDYVVYPWLVPGVRVEYTSLKHGSDSAAVLTRVIPGIAMAVRPNVRVILTGSIERGNGVALATNSPFNWAAAGASVDPTRDTKFHAETVTTTVAVAF